MRFVIKKCLLPSQKLLLSFVFFWCSALWASASDYSSFKELSGKIVSVDTAQRIVSIEFPGRNPKVYKIGFDAVIYLGNGEQGLLGSVKNGDYIDMIVDSSNDTIRRMGVRRARVYKLADN